MEIAECIKHKISNEFALAHMDLSNESHMHAGIATDSHYNLTVVSNDFLNLSAVKRHQKVYKCLSEELTGPVHALALHLYSISEWQAIGQRAAPSPDCAGLN